MFMNYNKKINSINNINIKYFSKFLLNMYNKMGNDQSKNKQMQKKSDVNYLKQFYGKDKNVCETDSDAISLHKGNRYINPYDQHHRKFINYNNTPLIYKSRLDQMFDDVNTYRQTEPLSDIPELEFIVFTTKSDSDTRPALMRRSETFSDEKARGPHHKCGPHCKYHIHQHEVMDSVAQNICKLHQLIEKQTNAN